MDAEKVEGVSVSVENAPVALVPVLAVRADRVASSVDGAEVRLTATLPVDPVQPRLLAQVSRLTSTVASLMA